MDRRLMKNIDLTIFNSIFWAEIGSVFTLALFSLSIIHVLDFSIYISFLVLLFLIFKSAYQYRLYKKFKKLQNVNLKINKDLLAKEEQNNRLRSEKQNSIISSTSHDMRTPLQSIIGFTDMLLSKENDEEKILQHEDIKNSAEVLLSLVNNLLDYSKIRDGSVSINRSIFSIEDKINIIEKMYLPKLKNKPVELIFNYEDTAKMYGNFLDGDSDKITQIFSNIVANSVKYTHQGIIYITIDYEPKNKTLIFECADTGIGIPPKKLDYVFDEFETAGRNGTGIGLSIVKKLVDLLLGEIEINSSLESGTTITIKLPIPYTSYKNEEKERILQKWEERLKDEVTLDLLYKELISIRKDFPDFAQAVEDENIDFIFNYSHRKKGILNDLNATELGIVFQMIHKQFENQELDLLTIKKSVKVIEEFITNLPYDKIIAKDFQFNYKNEEQKFKVLIVDDVENNITFLKFYLSTIKIECDSALSEDLALEKLKNESYDIIFLDINMPGIGGEGLLTEIKKMKHNLNAFIYAFTAYQDERLINKFLDLGFNDYITKPINPDKLYESISNIIKDL